MADNGYAAKRSERLRCLPATLPCGSRAIASIGQQVQRRERGGALGRHAVVDGRDDRRTPGQRIGHPRHEQHHGGDDGHAVAQQQVTPRGGETVHA
ncbi:MAG: hypothetical protein WA159_21950, partial [Variovorax sp.]